MLGSLASDVGDVAVSYLESDSTVSSVTRKRVDPDRVTWTVLAAACSGSSFSGSTRRRTRRRIVAMAVVGTNTITDESRPTTRRVSRLSAEIVLDASPNW